MLPEGESPPAGKGESHTTVGALAMALRYNEEHREQRILMAGHTDSVGADKDNDELSRPSPAPPKAHVT